MTIVGGIAELEPSLIRMAEERIEKAKALGKLDRP
jgi:hypothetical protein